MRRFALIAALALPLLAATPAAAAGGSISVALDHATRLRLAGPAGSVIVGNPLVADVTVVDDRTLYVSGRGYGVTEVIVLDKLGRTVFQGDVVVSAPTSGQVALYRGSQLTQMACAATCSASTRGSDPASAGASASPSSTGSSGSPDAGGGGSPVSSTPLVHPLLR